MLPGRSFISLGLLLTFSAPVSAQMKPAVAWPVFRGNDLQTGVADTALPGKLVVRWSAKTAEQLVSSPVIAGQTVFVGGLDSKLHAFDLLTGKKQWEYDTAIIRASPAVRGGAVYVGDGRGVFHCVDAVTGKKRWTVATDGDILSSANFVNGKILFGSNDHHLYCVDTDGMIVWKCKTKEKIQGSPAVAGDRILLGGCDQSLHVIDAMNGVDLKTIPLGGHAGASAAVHGDQVYLGTMSNRFLAVDFKKGTILWHFEAKRNPQAFYSSAAVTDDLVVAGCRDKQVRAWQRGTGKEVWAFATKGKVDSSPVIVGDRVYAGSHDGNFYILDLARGTEIARYELGPIPGSPAVAGQCVVVATLHGDVFCLGEKK